jgi:hypothetical protein
MTRRYPEHDFQAAAHVFLCRALPQGLHWGTDHAGARSPAAGARLKRRGIVPGIPDHFTLYRGTLIAWEWKAGKNSTTDSQLGFGADVVGAGGNFFVCRTIEEIEAALRSLGFSLRASAGGIDEKLAARAAAPRKQAKPRAEKPTTSQVRRVERLRGRVMF